MKPRRTSRLREPAAVYLPDTFVVDCSVCLPWYIKDEASEFCARLVGTLGRAEIWVPSLWRPELISAMVKAARAAKLPIITDLSIFPER